MLTNEAIKLPIKYGKDNKPKLDKSNRYSADGFIPDFDFMETFIRAIEKQIIKDTALWSEKKMRAYRQVVK